MYTDVQSAIDAASEGDLVKVAGYCAGVQSRAGVTQTVYLSKTLTIQGGYTTTNWIAPDPELNPTTLDAQGQGRVFYITGEISPSVEGLRITGGDAAGQGGSPWGSDSGGGVHVVDATATISDCVVLGNNAGLSGVGGGLYLLRSDSTLSGNTIEGNTADDPLDGYGGGLYLRESPALLRDNTVAANSANNDGGGIYLDMSDANLSGNTIISNHANSNGGGLHLWENSNAIIEGNTIVSNTAYLGGGMAIYYSPATLHANTVSANTATDWAAGILLQASNATLSGNAINDNICLGNGAGGLGLMYSDAILTDNIISSNEALLSGGAMYLNDSDAEIRGNILQSNGAHNAVFLWHSDAILDANVITGSHMGVFMHASSPLMTNNVIVGNSESGVVAEGAWPRLVHNTLAENFYGLRVTDRWQDGSYYTSTVALTNTILVNQTSGVIVGSGNEVSLEGTLWYGNTSNWSGDGTITTGTINVFADPAFVDAGSGDFHIQPTSAAMDAGADSGVVEDIDGDPRPQGAGYDIGADETESPASGTLNLSADLQGSTDDSGTLFTAWTGGVDADSCVSGQDGSCSIPVASGTYSITVEMASYLDSVWDSISVGEGESVTLPSVVLLGGDVNDDCVVNIQDLAFMGYRFNACEGDPLYDLRGDINDDGCINILDLAMAGGNFNRACPVPW